MTWHPERGWLSLGVRAATVAVGGTVLALGLTSEPGPLVVTLPEEAVEVKPRPFTPGASPMLIEQEQGTVEQTRPPSRLASVLVTRARTAAPPPAEPPQGHEQPEPTVGPPPAPVPPVPAPHEVVPRDDSPDGDDSDDADDSDGSDGSGAGSDDDETGSSGRGSNEDDRDDGGSGPD